MPMNHRLLGPSGLRVSEVCLGAMTFGDEAKEWGASRAEARRIFDVFAEAGGNFIDTAVNYCGGMSERYVGELIASERDRYVVATKYSAFIRAGDPNSGGSHRKSLIQALESSLSRLNTDYVDLYWVHVWDPLTPSDELMRVLDDQVRAGKVLHVGISDTPAWVVARANTLADFRGWSPFAGIQVEYSLIERAIERELVPMAHSLDLAVLGWAPLGRGLLTGKYTKDGPPEGEHARLVAGDPRLNSRNLAIAEAVKGIAGELDARPAARAIAWLLARSAPLVIPIVGARTVEQLRQSFAAVLLDLPQGAPFLLSEVRWIPTW